MNSMIEHAALKATPHRASPALAVLVTMVAPVAQVALLTLLAACGNNPPVPDWQMTARDALDRATAAYMGGNSRVETAEFALARDQLAGTGRVELVLRAELTRCAARVAALDFAPCAGYDQLSQDAPAADRAYAAYLAGQARSADIALLPAQHQAVAAAGNDIAAAAAMQAITDPLSKLVAAGVLLRASNASPPVLAAAVDTASAQGWRRPLLAWLGVQAMRAEQAGDTSEAQRLRRRIALASTEKPVACSAGTCGL